ncbi:glycoside hydrolase family 105 protein [Pedobacter cryoconitis]|uniref:glycoside hydrolase family 88/105 protein n=1 Tax=Pedobacter cryoconitis TaxID=188932 RepID=UPI0017B4ADB6|nr:glycoside hydrolase family 88 protein [Pedobacter cryoconitis]MBB5645334.1 unsaturated rhamnogalacturonyl hydrolase [Pedobacter cryoconitis]
MKRLFFLKAGLVCLFIMSVNTRTIAQTKPLSEAMAAMVMDIWQDSLNLDPANPKPVKWAYDQGVILEGIEAIWKRTKSDVYFKYMQKSMDFFVTKNGDINRYKQADYNIDNVKNGRTLLSLYKVTGQKKYFKAATLLWDQLKKQPRTKEGGFWHKKIYPNQMWLDGLYMGEPFYAEYAALIKADQAYDDIANQFIYMEKNARDRRTGLLYHGWDESKQERWADKKSGVSPNFWGRAMGWYGMALVDVLEYFPEHHPKRKALLDILDRLSTAIGKYQDKNSGLWYDILDQPDRKGNYKEASASCMFVYTISKGVRKGYLDHKYFTIAKNGFQGIKGEFIEEGAKPGQINLKGTVSVSGLGGKPYRDGSYTYYISEKVITNDPKGVGAFLLAASEMEIAEAP